MKYDPLLTSVIQKKKGLVKFMSPKVQNQIIGALGDTCREALLKQIRESPFFSIIADSTQDLSKVLTKFYYSQKSKVNLITHFSLNLNFSLFK